MGEIHTPTPVLHFCGAIFAPGIDAAALRSALEAAFGPVGSASPVFPFDQTAYYEREMGAGLLKIFFTFENFIDPGDIARIKIRTNEIEASFVSNGGPARPVNLDPGYISLSKLVLATTKDNYHRIYVRDGIYAETTLQFVGGSFSPFPWTYPDFRKKEYIDFFNTLRAGYKVKLQRPPAV